MVHELVEMVADDAEREAVDLLPVTQLQQQALAQVAGADAARLEQLDHREQPLDLLERERLGLFFLARLGLGEITVE